MGIIKEDVRGAHLRLFPDETALLKPFLFNFDVTYAKRENISNAQLSAYIISPDRLMREGFAFTDELLLVISTFKTIQPRVIQAVELLINKKPFKGRVDPLTYFLVSADDRIVEWTENYLNTHPQVRTPIPISVANIDKLKNDRWMIRNELASRLYSRDLFDYQLPLDEDLFFFGRQSLIDVFLDAIRKNQNQGLFGLRKTGKTSFLFKIRRTCEELHVASTFYLDCKRPDIRSLGWKSLLNLINDWLSQKVRSNYVSSADPVKTMTRLLGMLPENEKICLIFDEIEYISSISPLDHHWQKDFVPFWQTLWSVQSEFRKISFIVAGVNPYVCEIDRVDNAQNPMFGIVRPHYIGGLTQEETAQMIRAIGGRMGLGFEADAISYLHARYGGHPLLTRLACSFTNRSLDQEGAARPVSIKSNKLAQEEATREEELYFYCRYVISELKEFYSEEYDMLELLASGSIVDFNELSGEPGWIKHLKSYGIIAIARSGKPTFLIPVLQRFVAAEKARREKTRQLRTCVAAGSRVTWIEHRKYNIIRDLKLLLRTLEAKNMWQPYKSPILPEADLIQGSIVVSDWAEFGSFITDINKCLNESIDLAHDKAAFFGPLKSTYPELFDALHRIRLYRNNADHLRLKKSVEDAFNNYLEKDLYGVSISRVNDPWFMLQQIVLDELFSAIQYEISTIT